MVTVGVRVGTKVLVAVAFAGMGTVAVGGLGVSVICAALEFIKVGVCVIADGVMFVDNSVLIALDMTRA